MKKEQTRNTISRSLSFDPDVFAFIEDRRERLGFQRSEYLTRLVLQDMEKSGTKSDFKITELPEGTKLNRDRTSPETKNLVARMTRKKKNG